MPHGAAADRGKPPLREELHNRIDGGTNLPANVDIKNLRGIEATSSGSNFNIVEWITLRSLTGSDRAW